MASTKQGPFPVTTPGSHIVRVAAVRAEGCYFDLPVAVQKTCDLVIEAAKKGCDMIAFPEILDSSNRPIEIRTSGGLY